MVRRPPIVAFLLLLLFPGAGFSFADDRLPPLTLQSKYLNEHTGAEIVEYGTTWWGKQTRTLRPIRVEYITDPAERARHEVTVRDGKLYRADGTLLDTRGNVFTTDTGERLPFDRAIIVEDEAGKLYALSDPEAYRTHHSTLVEGKPVRFAGEVRVENGVLTALTDRSGHYKPTLRHTYRFIHSLEAKGVRVPPAIVDTDFGAFVSLFGDKGNVQPAEIEEFLKYSLRSTLEGSRKHPFNEFFLRQYGRPYLQVHGGFLAPLARFPEYVEALFDFPMETVSSGSAQFMMEAVRPVSARILGDPRRLANFAHAFGPESANELIGPLARELLEKAGAGGLATLTPADRTRLAVIRRYYAGLPKKARKPIGVGSLLEEIDRAAAIALGSSSRARVDAYFAEALEDVPDPRQAFVPPACGVVDRLLRIFKRS